MVTALYRRYRPENFAELIGQTQVTDPLRTALRTNRVNHAYLFSGPRGCGKTTSARILARCLNCAEGPTDTPCGVCPSCVELSRDGSGSLDVIEIDAASHNGVDDARDLRDRAIFAPARDRYKIFILDEAHMVTPQGFNALLKIVEEPPEHVKFIFATTEPDKVIGTIRSRTHHYPFRLVPPAQMLDYVGQLCETENVTAEPGVLPLVVRAGGGSVRDTLSLLDQLIAGSEGGSIGYERAVALLGYTHASLLDAVVDALGERDGATAFASVDRVIQTGQDPRRFVEDLLERLRDLIVVGATTEGAAAVLRGITPDELEHLSRQAHAFGAAELSRSADVVNRALTDMTGATSPRLHLELMIARVLVPESDETSRGALARVERLERRVGVDGSTIAAASAGEVPARAAAPAARPSASTATAAPAERAPAARAGAGPVDWTQEPQAQAQAPAAASPVAPVVPASDAAETSEPAPPAAPHSAAWVQAAPAASAAAAGRVSLQQLRDSWPEILEVVEKEKLSAWMVVVTATVRAFDDDVLTLSFPSVNDVDLFKRPVGAGEGVSEYLRRAIQQLLGVRVKYIARVERPEEGGAPAAEGAPRETAAPAQSDGSGAPQRPAEASQAAAPQTPAPVAAPETAAAPQAAAAPASEPQTAAKTPAASGPPAQQTTSRQSASPRSAAPQAAAGPAVPTTGWDVAPIPQSAPPEPDEPEYISEEPEGGVPTLEPAPVEAAPGGGVAAGDAPERPAAAAGATAPATQAAPAAREAAPAVATPAAAPAGRGVPRGSRYGEAVVREILNAQFIEEETIAPRVTPLSGPSEAE
ncbi:DNA polymerase III subunit gamma and tau [Frondihabitans sp. 762G35]|uniref:DNA polymerase III subunit gamma and tau n=1 Tax=Frondihabitans sp. 762G35 TaxID=1446794 RepID=UPI000E70687B|nr:DNA polymerase III subunit gamma and tau [Frondihabitans sp. 762G35]